MTYLQAIWLFVCITTIAPASADTIRITNGEWEPYVSQYSYQYGLYSHIVEAAFELEGIDVEWGFFPWKRAFHLAKNGVTWNASAVWWPTQETANHFYESDPVGFTSFVFFHRQERDFDWTDLEDIRHLKIGATLQYSYGPKMQRLMEEMGNHVEYVTRDELNYKKLLSGRIDIFPNDPVVGMAQIRNSLRPDDRKKLTFHPKTFFPSPLNLIFSKRNSKSKTLLQAFNRGLKKLNKSGEIDLMYKALKEGRYDKQETIWKPHKAP